MAVNAKKVVLDLLSATSAAADRVPVRSLVRAAAVFGITEGSVRVALARLQAARMIESPARGAYRLGAAAMAVNRQVVSWRDVESRLVPRWDGAWIGCHTAHLSRARRKAVRARERALRMAGMRALRGGLFVRPDNLAGGTGAVRARLEALGLDDGAIVFRLADLDAGDDAAARALWDTAGLEATYARIARELEDSEARLSELALEDAVRESFVLGGGAIRAIVLDPLLPAPLVDTEARAAMVAAMRHYDRVGIELWCRFLGVAPPAHRIDLYESHAAGTAPASVLEH